MLSFYLYYQKRSHLLSKILILLAHREGKQISLAFERQVVLMFIWNILLSNEISFLFLLSPGIVLSIIYHILLPQPLDINFNYGHLSYETAAIHSCVNIKWILPKWSFIIWKRRKFSCKISFYNAAIQIKIIKHMIILFPI